MQEIISYVNTCRQKGFSEGYIRKVLKEAGHQNYIIDKAVSLSRNYSGRKRTNKKVMSTILVLAILIGVFSVLSLTNFFVAEDPITGNIVAKSDYNDQVLKANEFLKAKNKVINQQIDMINELDLSVEEKNVLIIEQTKKINDLFDKMESERTDNLDASIELINQILNR
jgi:uncharacterized coiled-coil protein SlyX